MSIAATAANPYDVLNPVSSSADTSSSSSAATSDRFLKLLVTQLKNQDPLNPTDNAQITSQMAQISTVSGIEKLNTTMGGLNAQFLQLQSLQGAALVGHDVTIQGNKLAIAQGQGVGGFELATAADSVKVDILDTNGALVQKLDLGAQPAGMSSFKWAGAGLAAGQHFQVSASTAGKPVSATPLMRDHVNAVSVVDNRLTLETTNAGRVDYANVKAVN